MNSLRIVLAHGAPAPEAAAPSNALTAAEKGAGWRLLWDGKTTERWRSAKSDGLPTQGWSIENGADDP